MATTHRPKRPKAKPAGLGKKKSVFRARGVKKAKTTTIVVK
jgi:hypothetical protein